MVKVWPPDMEWLPKWSTIYMMTPGNWCPYAHIWGIWAYGHMGICEKIWSSGVSPKKASKMQLRNVNLRSVGPSVQKLWPTTFFAKKMPCILHGAEKKISNIISSQVSGRAQLPGVFIYPVDHFGNYFISGGHTSSILSHPNSHWSVGNLILWYFIRHQRQKSSHQALQWQQQKLRASSASPASPCLAQPPPRLSSSQLLCQSWFSPGDIF